MVKQIECLSLSNEDKIKAINIIKNQDYGSIHLEKLLKTCFLFLPGFHEKFNKKTKKSSIYKSLLEHDVGKRSIAFKTMLDKILYPVNDEFEEELDVLFKNLCDHKIIDVKVSILKYKIYIDTISNIDSRGVEWAKKILTNNYILKLDDEEYQNIANEIRVVAYKKKKSSFDDDGNLNLFKTNCSQFLSYKKIMHKHKDN